jgi:hypothetical protein
MSGAVTVPAHPPAKATRPTARGPPARSASQDTTMNAIASPMGENVTPANSRGNARLPEHTAEPRTADRS